MSDDHPGRHAQTCQRKQHHIKDTRASKNIPGGHNPQPEVEAGKSLDKLHTQRYFSFRNLAQQSGLNANTLNLIEYGKRSPSVSTLKQFTNSLNVPITAICRSDLPKNKISYQKSGQQPLFAFHPGKFQHLGVGLTLRGRQPLIVNLEPKVGRRPSPIVHTGHEFVYCLEGHLSYQIEDTQYPLEPGDRLLFEAHLPHSRKNIGDSMLHSLLELCPADQSDHPGNPSCPCPNRAIYFTSAISTRRAKNSNVIIIWIDSDNFSLP
jgi:quercetin dioxygenase-like cupin family protein/DNA-binding XRE family transcriptional regulator